MAFADHILPHGPIRQLDERLWIVTGSLRNMPMPRNMVIWRQDDGQLLLHSTIALSADGMTALEDLGTIATQIVPSKYHRLDAAVYKARYPTMQVLCPTGARRDIEKMLAVDAPVEEVLETLGGSIPSVPGLGTWEHIYEVPCGRGHALIANDCLFNLREHLPGFSGLVMRYLTGSTGHFGTSRVGRYFLGDKKQSFGAWLHTQADRHDLTWLALSHGEPLTGEARVEGLREAARALGA